MHTCVSVYVHVCLFFLGVYLTAGLTLCFSSIQGACFEQQHVFGPATRHFCRAVIARVCLCLSWLSTKILWLSASVDLLSSLDMYLPEFLVLLACVCILCHGVHQQTNRHSGDEKNSTTTKARAHTHVQAHMQRSLAQPSAAVVTSVMLIRSRSSHTHTYTDTQVCMFVCVVF
jgi:hypothetical protein